MKILTVRPPWSHAILQLGKNIENRSKLTSYRGELIIHAARQTAEYGFRDRTLLDAWARQNGDRPLPVPGWSGWHHGHIVGAVDLVDAHVQTDGCCTSAWAMTSDRDTTTTHLVLERPRTFRRTIAARGQLGLWTPGEWLRGEVDIARRESAVR